MHLSLISISFIHEGKTSLESDHISSHSDENVAINHTKPVVGFHLHINVFQCALL